jgi:hypothetical protein
LKHFIALSVLALTGCQLPPPSLEQSARFEQLAPNANFGEPPTDIETKLRARFATILKDPYSAMYAIGAPFKASCNDRTTGRIVWLGWAVKFTVNSKNGFGGYVGPEDYLFTFERGMGSRFDDNLISPNPIDGNEFGLWRDECRRFAG